MVNQLFAIFVASDPPARDPKQPELPPPRSERCNPLLLSFVSFFAIGFGVWLVAAVHDYREEYAQATEAWRVGSIRTVQITLVKDDKHDLACASDEVIGELRCGHGRDLRPVGSSSADDPKILQPFNTTQHELFLGAGLWTSSDLKGSLPQTRFVVSCTYHVDGVMKSVSARFGIKRPFAPLRKTVTAGALTDCVLPQ